MALLCPKSSQGFLSCWKGEKTPSSPIWSLPSQLWVVSCNFLIFITGLTLVACAPIAGSLSGRLFPREPRDPSLSPSLSFLKCHVLSERFPDPPVKAAGHGLSSLSSLPVSLFSIALNLCLTHSIWYILCVCVLSFRPCLEACGILVPRLAIEPMPCDWELGVLTAGPPRKSL